VSPGAPSFSCFRRDALERRRIRRGDDVAVADGVDPRLHQVCGLGEHETRGAGLIVGKRALEPIDHDRARRLRQINGVDASKRKSGGVEDENMVRAINLRAHHA
jgi:hypothetical protein